jgi:hypothetical protein
VVAAGRRTAGPSATPDFPLTLMALADFMRFSPTENRTRGCVQRSVAGNPGTLPRHAGAGGMTKFRGLADLGVGYLDG